MSSQLELYMEAHGLDHTEGARGVRNMETVMREVCGYNGDYGTVLHNFFADNSGAVTAVLEWIGSARVSEWKEKLDELMPEDDYNEEIEE